MICAGENSFIGRWNSDGDLAKEAGGKSLSFHILNDGAIYAKMNSDNGKSSIEYGRWSFDEKKFTFSLVIQGVAVPFEISANNGEYKFTAQNSILCRLIKGEASPLRPKCELEGFWANIGEIINKDELFSSVSLHVLTDGLFYLKY